jgi:hypothetical protein
MQKRHPEMKQNKIIEPLLLISFVALYIYELLFELPYTKKTIDNFFPLLLISIFCLAGLGVITKAKQDVPKEALFIFKLLLIWQSISFIRGAFSSTEYLDIKNLFINKLGGLSVFIPLALYAGLNYKHSKKMLNFTLLTLLFSFVLIPLSLTDEETEIYLYSRSVTPVLTFMIFIPYVSRGIALLILVVSLTSAYIALSWRANIIRISTSFAVLLSYYLRRFHSFKLLNVARMVLFALPLVLLFAGLQGKNIFESSTEGTEIEITSKGETENLAQDTRTELYTEVLSDLSETGDIWFGRNATGKYRTDIDFNLPSELGNMRPDVEVGFLKILIHHGILGLVLYFLVLWKASYYGICKTNNRLSQMLGLLISLHWVIIFLENIITYNPYYYFHWFTVGLCLSESFRLLTDSELKEWLTFKWVKK